MKKGPDEFSLKSEFAPLPCLSLCLPITLTSLWSRLSQSVHRYIYLSFSIPLISHPILPKPQSRLLGWGLRVCFKNEILAFMACYDSRSWGFSACFVKKIGAFMACYHSKFWVLEFVTIGIKMHFSSVPSQILINCLKCWLLSAVSSTNFSTTVPFYIA